MKHEEALYNIRVQAAKYQTCGNQSGTESKQWLLGVRYEDGKAVFTVTDVGKGILDTLHRRFSKKLFETFTSSDRILMGAFDKKCCIANLQMLSQFINVSNFL
ncbi:MAG: hypothetical protein KDD36_12375 [Flavobacteriales bacterium]|nr:hypothetical protein [Flavobacteriales bacterium]